MQRRSDKAFQRIFDKVLQRRFDEIFQRRFDEVFQRRFDKKYSIEDLIKLLPHCLFYLALPSFPDSALSNLERILLHQGGPRSQSPEIKGKCEFQTNICMLFISTMTQLEFNSLWNRFRNLYGTSWKDESYDLWLMASSKEVVMLRRWQQ